MKRLPSPTGMPGRARIGCSIIHRQPAKLRIVAALILIGVLCLLATGAWAQTPPKNKIKFQLEGTLPSTEQLADLQTIATYWYHDGSQDYTYQNGSPKTHEYDRTRLIVYGDPGYDPSNVCHFTVPAVVPAQAGHGEMSGYVVNRIMYAERGSTIYYNVTDLGPDQFTVVPYSGGTEWLINLSALVSHSGYNDEGYDLVIYGEYTVAPPAVPISTDLLTPPGWYHVHYGTTLHCTWEYNGPNDLTYFTVERAHDVASPRQVIATLPANVFAYDMSTFGLETSGHYFWAVNAHNASGSTPEADIEVKRFYLHPTDAPPNPIAPIGVVEETSEITFQWSEVPAATRYRLQIETAAGALVESVYVTDNQYTRAMPLGDFVWKVQMFNVDQNYGDWSVTSAFSHQYLVPQNVTVAGTALASPDPVVVSWDPIPGALVYFAEIASNPDFAAENIEYSGTPGVNETTWAIVKEDGPFWVRVRSLVGTTFSDYSTPVSFNYDYSFMPISYNGGQNAVGVGSNYTFGAIFNNPIDGATLTDDSHRVVGEQSISIPHSMNLWAGQWIQCNLYDGFRAGERVTVTMTSDIASSLPGQYLEMPRSFSFTTATAGNAEFYPADRVAWSGSSFGACVADLNGDGDLDIATANGTAKTISVSLSDGNGGYGAAASYNIGPNLWEYYYAFDVAAGDFDNDGDIDLVSANFDHYSVSFYENNGSGGFGTGTPYRMQMPTSSPATEVHAVDVDGDGDLDAVCGTQTHVLVFENLGGAVFETDVPLYPTTDDASHICVGDMNNDGLPDVVASNRDTGQVSVLFNAGDGTFGAAITYPGLIHSTAVVCADIDGDSYLDIAVTRYEESVATSYVRVHHNDGSGGLASFTDYAIDGDALVSALFCDADGDQEMDLIVGKNGDNDTPEDIVVMLNDGNGGFATPQYIDLVSQSGSTFYRPNALDAGDMDGDGTIDIVVSDFSPNETVILCNQAVPPAVVLTSPPNYSVLEVAGPHLHWEAIAGTHIQYTVEVDADAAFTAPILRQQITTNPYWAVSPTLASGTYYWHVKATNGATEGPWSETRRFTINLSTPSCPVLYIWQNGEFVQENTLLTACEQSGYRDVVTDYYQLPESFVADGDVIDFQLREMEDEITYLKDLELITVDYPEEAGVLCTVDGRIVVYDEVVSPISAIDQEGNDCLDLITERDGRTYTSNSAGQLTLIYADGDEGCSYSFLTPLKVCIDPQELTPGEPGKAFGGGLTVEQLEADGTWIELGRIPVRDSEAPEVVAPARGKSSPSPVTLRLIWNDGFKADVLSQYRPSGEQPTVQVHRPSDYELHVINPEGQMRGKLAEAEPMQLHKGDRLDCSFEVDMLAKAGQSRAYIVRAVGRYEPDYSVYTNLTPNAVKMHGNYPNPFNPRTTFKFDLDRSLPVRFSLYDLHGRLVKELVAGTVYQAGAHEVVWDGRDRTGQQVASGTYFYRFEAGSYQDTGHVTLVK